MILAAGLQFVLENMAHCLRLVQMLCSPGRAASQVWAGVHTLALEPLRNTQLDSKLRERAGRPSEAVLVSGPFKRRFARPVGQQQ